MLRALTIAAIAIAAPALARDNPRDEEAVARALAGRVAGEPRKCLNSYESDRSSVHEGTVLFRVNSRLVYKNDMQGCDLLHEDDILQTNLFGSRLCEGDIAQVINRAGGFGKGACTFGEFVPYRR